MTRWNWKRWAFAIVTGTALTGTAALTSAADLPKTGETITMKFPGQPERTVTIVKATKKPDGSVETEVKDSKNGETFTLIDPAPASKVPVKPAAVSPAVPVPPPVTALPPLPKPVGMPEPAPARPAFPAPLPPVSVKPMPVSAKPYVPVIPPLVSKSVEPVKAPMSVFAEAPSSPPKIAPPAPVEEPRDKKLIGGRLLNREPVATPRTPAAEASAPAAPVEEKKPGIIGRIFGKKPATTVMPAAPAIAAAPSAPPRANAEPPRVMQAKPVAPARPGRIETVVPPTPAISSVPVPSSVPSVSAIPTPLPASKPTPLPIPVPTPSIPTPSIPTPTIPVPPIQSSLPVVPAVEVKPAGTTATVRTASNTTPIEMGLPAEIQPQATTLRDALAPSHRMLAAKGLAEGRDGSSDAVKAVLFHAAKTDPCPAVKACCIEHLCTLGYFDPAFLKHLKVASDDTSEEVRTAAKAALVKMSPR